MPATHHSDIPEDTLLAPYQSATLPKKNQNYCDCYTTTVDCTVSLEEYVYAFYTSPLFRIERKILAIALKLPASDQQARQLLNGDTDTYSAWKLHTRRTDEMLLLVPMSRTGSWFMVRNASRPDKPQTELLFGSVVFPQKNRAGMGFLFYSLLGFHKLYSHLLLRAAVSRLHRPDSTRP